MRWYRLPQKDDFFHPRCLSQRLSCKSNAIKETGWPKGPSRIQVEGPNTNHGCANAGCPKRITFYILVRNWAVNQTPYKKLVHLVGPRAPPGSKWEGPIPTMNAPMHSGQNMPFSYWSVMFSIPFLQLIVLETGNVLMGHPNWKRIQ